MNSWSKNNYESCRKEEKHESCRKEDRYEDRYDDRYDEKRREDRYEDRYDEKRREEKHEEKRHEEKRRDERKCETFLKCGCPNSTTIPVITETTVNRTFTLATLRLDTSCICDPKIKLDFASNIISTEPLTGSFTIQIFKQCKHQFTSEAIGPSWEFNVVDDTQSITFSFFVCDSDGCEDDCCTYTAVARVITTNETVSINNATLAATVTCGENECHKKCNRRHDY